MSKFLRKMTALTFGFIRNYPLAVILGETEGQAHTQLEMYTKHRKDTPAVRGALESGMIEGFLLDIYRSGDGTGVLTHTRTWAGTGAANPDSRKAGNGITVMPLEDFRAWAGAERARLMAAVEAVDKALAAEKALMAAKASKAKAPKAKAPRVEKVTTEKVTA